MNLRHSIALPTLALLSIAPALAQVTAGSLSNELLCPSDSPRFAPASPFERGADFGADIAPQIQRHFAEVIEQLESKDVSSLDEDTRTRRREHIDVLSVYAARGQFPLNDQRSYPTPVFIDDAGTACAVAHLMVESGAVELAHEIKALQNLAYLEDIAVLGASEWIASSGLTPEECALIQPSYPCNLMGTVGSTYCGPAVPNSTGFSAEMMGCGSNMIANNFLLFDAIGMAPSSSALMLNSRTAGLVVQPGGSDGNLCLGGAIGRHNSTVFTTSSFGSALVLVDLTAIPTPTGFVSAFAGETWNFQIWFRDQASSNFTSAVRITFS